MEKKDISWVLIAALVIVLVFIVGIGLVVALQGSDKSAKFTTVMTTVIDPNVKIGGEFTLTNQNGQTISSTDFRGKLLLVYFGFTHCPDVCPTDVGIISQVMEQLGKEGEHVQPFFITIDPERDTPERLKEFLSSFHPSIQGLTGSMEEVKKVESAYRVYARKIKEEKEKEEKEEEYTMDHSAFTFLMGKDGAFLQHFNHGTAPADMANAIREAWKKAGQEQ